MNRPFVLWEAQGNTLEDDCACPYPSSQPASCSTNNEAYTCASNLYTAPLPAGCRLAFSPGGTLGPAVVNQGAWDRLQGFARPQPLRDSLDAQLAAAELVVPLGRQPRLASGPPDTLTAWLHVTNACNLDCPYCYVRKSSARMSGEVGLAAIESLFHSAQANGLHAVKLKYAGGEALLHFQLIQTMHTRAQALARSTGLALQAVVLSNGVVITPEMTGWLLANEVRLMISVDGVGQAHDRQRPTRGGRGSFAQVERTLDQVLLPPGLRPDICITITARNAPTVAEMMRWVRARDLPFSLNFYRETSLARSRPDLALEEKAIVAGMRAAYAVLENDLPMRPFLCGLLDRVQAHAHSHTCGLGQSYVVITHTGKVAQCQMRLEQPVGQVGEKDLLQLVASGPLRNLSVDEKEGCRDCAWRYRCAGGCPLETYRATGRFDVKSPHCGIYTALFPDALRLEGLRLLKAGGYLS
jgi:uncharacterized protein